MCGELYKKIAPGFIETPTVKDQVGDEAYIIVDRIEDAGFGEVFMVVAFDKRKWNMPDRPNYAEDETGGKKIETPPDAMGAVSAPAKLFDYRDNKKQKPNRNDSRAKGKVFRQFELFAAAPQQK